VSASLFLCYLDLPQDGFSASCLEVPPSPRRQAYNSQTKENGSAVYDPSLSMGDVDVAVYLKLLI